MGSIATLHHREAIVVDNLRVAQIFRNMGAPCAESSIMARVEALTTTLHRMDAMVAGGAIADIPALARQARESAHAIGLISLSSVLGSLDQACKAGDWPAAKALWHRACRVGDASLMMLWDLPQLRM